MSRISNNLGPCPRYTFTIDIYGYILNKLLIIPAYYYIRSHSPMTLTKIQIIESIQTQTGFSRNRSSEIVESLLEIIKSTLSSGEDVLVSGFGKFCVKQKNERKGRNPATGGDLMLAPRKVATFKCSGKLRDKING
jgi:integration host factor subunit alpha